MRLKLSFLVLGFISLLQSVSFSQNQVIYNLPHSSGEALFGFTQTADGNYVIGYDENGSHSGFIKIQEDGTPIWAKDYGFKGEVIQEMPDQSLIIGGYTDAFGSDNDIFLMRMDANGNLLWIRQYQYPGNEQLKDLIITPTGCIVVAVKRGSGGVAMKTDGAGNLLWAKETPNGVLNGVENVPGNNYLFAGSYYNGAYAGWAFYLDSLGNYTPYLAIANQQFGDCAVTTDSTYLFYGDVTTNYNGQLVVRKPSTGYAADYSVSSGNRLVTRNITALQNGEYLLTAWDYVQFNGPEAGFCIKVTAQGPEVNSVLTFPTQLTLLGSPLHTRAVSTLDGGYAFGISFVEIFPQNTMIVDTATPSGSARIYKIYGNEGLCGNLRPTPFGLTPNSVTNASISPSVNVWSPVTIIPTVTVSNFTLGVQAPSCFACVDTVVGSFSSANIGPNQFGFSASTSNTYSIDWDFGDGNFGNGSNPTHTYTNSGNYQVCMTMNGPCDTVSICQNITVCNIGAFTGNGNICGPGNGSWTATLPATSHDWILNGVSVGTGTTLSLSGLPDNGYTLIHVATDAFCTDSDTLVFFVSASAPTANFTYSYFNHDFTGVFSGTGPGAIEWDFGDGNTAFGDTVTHHYASGDTFNICLMISNGCGADTLCQQIVCPLPVADFSFSGSSNPFSFTNLSVGALSYSWIFGDGGTDTAAHPTHLFPISGNYTVQLIAENGCGIDTHTESVVAINPSAQIASERFYLDAGFEVVKVLNDPNGGFLVFGNIPNPTYAVANFALLKLNAQGETVWMKSYANTYVETIFRDAAISSTNQIYVAGTRGTGSLLSRMDLLGNVIWTRRIPSVYNMDVVMPLFNGNVAFMNHVSYLEVTAAGAFVSSRNIGINISNVKPTTNGGYISINSPGKVVKLDSAGTIDWVLEDSSGNKILDYLPLANGNAVVAIANPTPGTTVNLKCIDALGGDVWGRAYDVGAYCTVKLQQDPSGSVAVLAPLVTGEGYFGLMLDENTGALISGFDQTGSSPGTKIKGFGLSNQSTYYGWGTLSSTILGPLATYGVTKVMPEFTPAFSCGAPFSPSSSPYSATLRKPTNPNNATLSITVASTAFTASTSVVTDSAICYGFCDPDIAPITFTLVGNTITVQNPDGGIVDLGDGSPTRQDVSFSYTYASLPATLCNYYYQNCAPAQACTTLVNVPCGTAGIAGGSGGSCPGSQTLSFSGSGTPTAITWTLDGSPAGNGTSLTVNLTNGAHTLVQVADFGSCLDTATLSINISDVTPPTASCPPAASIYLDANGTATLNATAFGSGSTDNCGIATMALSPSSFSCNDIGAGGGAADLFFSEYIEGNNQNKTIEIFNGTGQTVNLGAGNYALRVYYNGATTYTEFPLSGTVADGDVFVFGRVNAIPDILDETDQTTTVALWTGDDAVELVKGGVTLDIFGRIGEDPGSGWSAGGRVTLNQTLIRKATVTGGITTNPSSGFPTLDTEWDYYPIDYIADLGIHTFSGGGSAPMVTLTVTDSAGNVDSCSAPYVVLDTLAPAITCQDITVQLDQNGIATIAPQDLTATATDNCALGSSSLDISSFDCSDVGTTGTPPTDLFISEYIEGSNQNKAIELFNGTGSAINLGAGNYAIRVYFNGSTSFTNFPLTGTVAAGDVFVLSRYNADPAVLAQADQTTTGALWTGDDAIALVKGNTVLDLFGRIGEDPGSGWNTGGNVTINKTLIRNNNITSGVTTNPSAGFPTLGTEWTMLLQDDFSNLGTHNVSIVPAGVQVTLSVGDGSYNVSSCTATVMVQANCTARFDTCNNDIVVSCPIPGGGAATVTWTAPAAEANCPSCPAPTVTQIGGAPSGSQFAQSTSTTITYVATIAGGNPDTCSFQVIVPLCKKGLDQNGLEPEGTLAAGQQAQPDNWRPEVFPNPFSERVTFRFDANMGDEASLTVTDLNGRVVHVMRSAVLESGTQQWNWTAGDVTAGVYFYRLQVGERVAYGKVERVR